MKHRVFILEDDESILGLVRVSLEMNGIETQSFTTVKDFYAALQSGTLPDVALLDVMLPDGNGFDVLKKVRGEHPSVNCIMLSALGKEENKVNGLNLGADDYVTKPFSVLELTARVNAALRRKKKDRILKSGALRLDTDTMEAELNGEKLELNRKEFELLKYFMSNPGIVLSRESILNEVWGYETGETRTLDNHVARLRKLGIPRIETVFGVGYKFTN